MENPRCGFQGLLVDLPLVDRDETIGVVTLYDVARHDFSRTDLLRGLGQMAAQAIANARVHAALDDGATRLRQIHDAGLELASSLDMAHVLEAAGRRVCDVAGVDSCDVYTLRATELRCQASLLRGSRNEERLSSGLSLRDWRAARLAVESRSLVRAPSREDQRSGDRADRDGPQLARHNGLVVPLVVERQVIGVVSLFDTGRQRTFSDDDVAGVEAVCRVAALAIVNAGLFRDAQLRGRGSELLNEIAARAGSSLDTRTIAASTVEELAALVPFTEACLTMAGDDGSWDLVYGSSPSLKPSGTATTRPRQKRSRPFAASASASSTCDRPRSSPSGTPRRGRSARSSRSASSSTTRWPASCHSALPRRMPLPTPTGSSSSEWARCSPCRSGTPDSIRRSRPCTWPT